MSTKAEIKTTLATLEERLHQLEKALSIDAKRHELQELAKVTLKENFWDDRQTAQRVLQQQTNLKKTVETFTGLQSDVKETTEFIELIDSDSDPLLLELDSKAGLLEEAVRRLEFQRMFQHEADPNGAIVSINSGAGGTEAQDWVAMLLRLYLRWCERNNLQARIVDELPGEEAGYKNVTFTVDGQYAYGNLKAEAGIHRLVRISPFDANARRHTSFASVFVIPEVSQEIEIEVKDCDIRVVTYRASGAGGQHINKTDSAVRMTHLSTGLVAQCQNERSQHKNRATCLKILKSKLYELELIEREKQFDSFHANKKDIAWGSQIRSYVLHPYQLVKDHRTKLEVGNINAVLDGEITPFIEAYLLWQDESGSEKPGDKK